MQMKWMLSSVCGLLIAGVVTAAAQGVREGPVETQATVSVESKGTATLDPAMVKVEVNGHETPLTSLTRIVPASAQVAILVDDGLRSSFGVQLKDVQNFIQDLPEGTQVLVGYMRNGGVKTEGGFSADHAAVAETVRVPLSSPGISGSPYFCLSDIAKHWPSRAAGTRFVLMLTNGVDLYNGSVSITNQDSPYVQDALSDAQRAGIAVYAIAYTDAGIRGGAASLSGQSYLSQVAEATGGRSLYNGIGNPPSLSPFLKGFRSAIAESYTATFMASATHEKEDTLSRLKIKTSQPGLKLRAPEAVHPGGLE